MPFERLSCSGEPSAAMEAPLTRAEVLESARRGLRKKELIIRRESSAFAETIEYVFKHELLRSVAYGNLLRKSLRVYHGQWLHG